MQTMDDFGYIGVFLLIALENLFPPIPSEIILTFGGFMTTYSHMTVAGVVLAATAGSVAGAAVLYAIGYWLDRDRMAAIVRRWGRWLRLTPKDVDKAYQWFEKRGAWTVLLCRMIPLIRSLISIPAGSTRMNFGLFLLLTTVGSLIWNVALVMLGAAVGASWENIVTWMDVYSNVVYAALLIGVLALLALLLRRKKSAADR